KNGSPGPCGDTTGHAKSPAARRRAHETYSNESSFGVRTIGRSHTCVATCSLAARATAKTIREVEKKDPEGDGLRGPAKLAEAGRVRPLRRFCFRRRTARRDAGCAG